MASRKTHRKRLRKIREKMNAITMARCNEIKKAVSQRPSAFGRFYIVHSFPKEASRCVVSRSRQDDLFAMLSGLLPKTNGAVSMGGAVNSGYCAQTNGVEDFLAPAEHLDLFASVVPPKRLLLTHRRLLFLLRRGVNVSILCKSTKPCSRKI